MFDGVGGFTIGLNNADKEFYKTKYSNQFEPSRKSQDAYEVGVYRFPEMEHIPDDVAEIPDEKYEEMKDNGINMIVGGFPCQDYSVARSSKNEMGIEGKKGVLFWEIIRAVRIIQPDYLILENVDRLLKSPTNQRGRDFAIMLGAFNELGYSVEWRVINAAEYGRAQRRRRVFIFIYKNETEWAKYNDEKFEKEKNLNLLGEKDFSTYAEYLFNEGLFARQFPVKKHAFKDRFKSGKLSDDIKDISDNYSDGKFWNTGIMRHGYFYTTETEPLGDEKPIPLKDILEPLEEVDEEFLLTDEKIDKFKYLRGAKKIKRVSEDGHEYVYSEGGMSEYDDLELPGRTILTSEGTVNRSTHIVNQDGVIRFITPIEAERMQDFPDNWTKYKMTADGEVEQVSNRMRLFFMGNALVTNIVKRIGMELKNIHTQY